MQNTTHTHCLRCGRTLHTPRSQSLGYGPKCARHIVRAANATAAAAADYKQHQVASAWELIEDGAIIPLRSVVFIAVSTDGTETYRTAPTGCTCPAGLKGSRCYHQLAARMLLAA